MTETILVTGGAGYIGSHVCKTLSQMGYLPVSYDNLSRGFAHAVKWGPLEQGDIRDADRLDQVLNRHSPAAVMHFAAFAYVGESMAEPDLYWDNNVIGSQTLLNRAVHHGVDKVVFSSSCTVYGDPDSMPLTETMPTRPVNPYGKTKLAIEDHLKALAESEGLNSVSLRYFNAAGADPDGDIGENHDPETHLVPLVLQSALDPNAPITVFGDDYDTPDGSCIRDYVHVTDLADAHVRALTYMQSNTGAHRFNLGNSNGNSVFDIIGQAERITGSKIPYLIGHRRPGDVAELVSEVGLAARELGWVPKHSDLDTILSSAWDWLQKSHQ